MNQPIEADELELAWVDNALARPDEEATDAVRMILENRNAIEAEWRELCAWDPELPPDVAVRAPSYFLTALASTLTRPQPLGWGLDPALERAALDLATSLSTPEHAVAQMTCLAEAFDRLIVSKVDEDDQLEILRRLHMVFARLIAHTVRESTHHLRTLAFVDPLTGLPNRRAFDDDLAREVSRARRHGHALSLAVVDIDGLKKVNDSAGHGAGDDLLRAVAATLRTALRREDVAYRVGGDEFAVLLPAIDVRDDGFLRQRLESDVSLSIGVASSTRDPVDDLFTVADTRLYEGRRRRRS